MAATVTIIPPLLAVPLVSILLRMCHRLNRVWQSPPLRPLLFVVFVQLIVVPCVASPDDLDRSRGHRVSSAAAVGAAVAVAAGVAAAASAGTRDTDPQPPPDAPEDATVDNPPETSKPKFKPQPPRRKKGRLEKRRKKSSYDHASARAALGLDANANSQQVVSALTAARSNVVEPRVPEPLSPPKSIVKQQNKRMRSKIEKLDAQRKSALSELEDIKRNEKISQKKIRVFERDRHSDQFKINKLEEKSSADKAIIAENKRQSKANEQKLREFKSGRAKDEQLIAKLKDENEKISALDATISRLLVTNKSNSKRIESLVDECRKLANLLREEKEKSRLTIASIMEGAEAAMDQAQSMKANVKSKEEELKAREMQLELNAKNKGLRFDKAVAVAMADEKNKSKKAMQKERRHSARQRTLLLEKVEKQLEQTKDNHSHQLEANAKKSGRIVTKLQRSLSDMMFERSKWESRLDKLNEDLARAGDRVYLEKKKARDAVQLHMNKAAEKEAELKNYIAELEDTNRELDVKLCAALAELNKANRSNNKAKRLSAARLRKWHAEREARKDAQNELAHQEKIFRETKKLMEMLRRLKEVMEKIDSSKTGLIPSPDEIDTQKLCQGGVSITDTCATAQKVRRILVEDLPGSFDYDCMHHLRNVWLGGMEKALTKRLNEILRSSLDEIDPKLRVTASISAIIRAIDKEFSLSANYPKGHGELFLEWMRDNHLGELLFHVERAAGSRQDLCTEGAMAIIANYPYYLEFLDETLRKRDRRRDVSILQKNLFVVLKSSEMIALLRLLSIIHLSVTMPMRWLAGKSHELRKFEWGPMSMGRVLDTLEKKMVQLSRSPAKITDESFMMSMFDEFINELPPLKKYLDDMFSKKQMKVVARKSGTKVVHLARLKSQLFSPQRKSEKDTTTRMKELARVAADAILAELRDTKKATHKYLSSSGSDYCWKRCSDERKQALLGKKATNDEAESSLGGTTSQVQKFGRIALSSAAAISDLKRNAFFNRPTNSKKEKPLGIFHQFDVELRHAIVALAMQDAPATRSMNNEALVLQAKARKEKEDLAKQKNMTKATEEYIEATYLINMYHSEACMKDDPKNVTQMLRKLGSNTAKLNAIKTNIMIRVKGFGWEWCAHAWSKNGRKYTVTELANHLRTCIRKESQKIKKGLVIPTEPMPKMPSRRPTGTLGTDIDFIAELDAKYLADESEFKKKAERIRQKRETDGNESIYSRMQPFHRPELADLLDKRIDVYYEFDLLGGGKDMRWCQGKVIEVYENRSKPTVRVEWDAMKDVKGFEETTESDVNLMPSKWNKDCELAWRMDVDIAVGEGLDDDVSLDSDDDEASEEDVISSGDESDMESSDGENEG
ncbi:hypothetical protein ACHAWF_015887 [Thalassiosira exigua]